eukprot:TRINITY_DN1970_c0_g1_i6.p1 TRINITY_DN1970_c0_g1~~TRINITY_DN1970_c0_g1_i6.p1  ORF type:complete len:142 (-),score=8.03 TRINITY_DN1970_c0_g1_i6:135-560(-)
MGKKEWPENDSRFIFYLIAHRDHVRLQTELAKDPRRANEAAGLIVDRSSKDGWTSLLAASCNGHYEGAHIDKTDRIGKTPLWVAAAGGHADTVRLLLEKGANKHCATLDGMTPELIAEENGHKEVAEMIRRWPHLPTKAAS